MSALQSPNTYEGQAPARIAHTRRLEIPRYRPPRPESPPWWYGDSWTRIVAYVRGAPVLRRGH